MRGHVSTLLIAKPGALRESLMVLLMALPQVVAVKRADNPVSALSIIESHHPALILLDLSLPQAQCWALLRQIRHRWPKIQCLVLVDHVQSVHHAEAMGADKALLKGYPAAKLSMIIERMLC